MSFSRLELEKMLPAGLLRLASYLGIEATEKTPKGKIIDKIMAELDRRGRDYRSYGISSEAIPEVPRYSVRVQRIMDSKKEQGEI